MAQNVNSTAPNLLTVASNHATVPKKWLVTQFFLRGLPMSMNHKLWVLPLILLSFRSLPGV